MNKLAPPLNFGVFKPVHHTVLAFRSEEALHLAQRQLLAQGFGAHTMVHYSAQEMQALAHAEMQAASPLAIFGYEITLLRAHQRLAEQGCAFLVVHAPASSQQQTLTRMVQQLRPVSAQHYGHLLIEDLTENPPGSDAERPERVP